MEQSRHSLCFWLPQTIPVNCMKEANRITTMNLTRIHSRRIRPGSHDQHWLTSKINLWNQLFRAGNVRHTSASNLFISTEKFLTLSVSNYKLPSTHRSSGSRLLLLEWFNSKDLYVPSFKHLAMNILWTYSGKGRNVEEEEQHTEIVVAKVRCTDFGSINYCEGTDSSKHQVLQRFWSCRSTIEHTDVCALQCWLSMLPPYSGTMSTQRRIIKDKHSCTFFK